MSSLLFLLVLLLFYLLHKKVLFELATNALNKFIAFFFSLLIVADDFLFEITSCYIKRSFLSGLNNFIPFKIIKINKAFYWFFSCFLIFFSFLPFSLSSIWSIKSFFDSLLQFFLFILSLLISFFLFRCLVLTFSFFGGFGGFISVLISTFTFVFLFFFGSVLKQELLFFFVFSEVDSFHLHSPHFLFFSSFSFYFIRRRRHYCL